MIKSMTGFGKGQIDECGYSINCELKSVNHRFFDVHIRMPRGYLLLEERIKEKVKTSISRGRLEIGINIEKTEESIRTIKVDKELAMAYHNSLKDLAKDLNISGDIKVLDIFRLPDVYTLINEEEDNEKVWSILEKVLDQCIDSLLDMRSKEGKTLAIDILNRNDYILEQVLVLEARSPKVSMEYEEKLQNRINEMINKEFQDEGRIIQEVAIFADKSSVTEEIVRLKSHISQLKDLINIGDNIGRKCDFLVQEMFREINTIASKSSDITMNQIVVDVKAELEKIREQLQNIE
ncbi:MAG: YicC/YloC family endoribonuclease [Bacillota bacterium]|nr:YicC/YloC family endoribonuclease [Bacillota bacterium]